MSGVRESVDFVSGFRLGFYVFIEYEMYKHTNLNQLLPRNTSLAISQFCTQEQLATRGSEITKKLLATSDFY